MNVIEKVAVGRIRGALRAAGELAMKYPRATGAAAGSAVGAGLGAAIAPKGEKGTGALAGAIGGPILGPIYPLYRRMKKKGETEKKAADGLAMASHAAKNYAAKGKMGKAKSVMYRVSKASGKEVKMKHGGMVYGKKAKKMAGGGMIY